jgi:hypothetical protein
MNPQDLDQYLESLLESREPYIPDEGFTSRVITTLPQHSVSPWVRMGIIGVFAIASCALVFFILPSGTILTQAMENVAFALMYLKFPGFSSLLITGLLIGCAAGLAKLEMNRN